MNFRLALKNLLFQHDLTQADVARRSGLHYSVVNRAVNEDTNPTMETVSKIAHVFGLSAAELVAQATQIKNPTDTELVVHFANQFRQDTLKTQQLFARRMAGLKREKEAAPLACEVLLRVAAASFLDIDDGKDADAKRATWEKGVEKAFNWAERNTA